MQPHSGRSLFHLVKQEAHKQAALNGAVVEALIGAGISKVPVAHGNPLVHPVVGIPQQVRECDEILPATHAADPMDPVGLGVGLPAVQRDSALQRLGMVALLLALVEIGREQAGVPQLVPYGIVLQTEGALLIEGKTVAAVRIAGAAANAFCVGFGSLHMLLSFPGSAQPLQDLCVAGDAHDRLDGQIHIVAR